MSYLPTPRELVWLIALGIILGLILITLNDSYLRHPIRPGTAFLDLDRVETLSDAKMRIL